MGMSDPVVHDGNRLRFSVHAYEVVSLEVTTSVRIYEVGPLPDNSVHRLHARLGGMHEGSSELEAWWTAGDCAYLVSHELCAIWDFERSTLVSWDPHLGDGESIVHSACVGNFMAAWTNYGNLYMWRIPTLLPLQNSGLYNLPTISTARL